MTCSSVGIRAPLPVITCQLHCDTAMARPVAAAGGPHATRAHACTLVPWSPLRPARARAKLGGRRVDPLVVRVAVRTSAYDTPAGALPRQAVRPAGSAGHAGRPGPVPQTTVTAEVPSAALALAYCPARLSARPSQLAWLTAQVRASATAPASAPLCNCSRSAYSWPTSTTS